MKIAICFFGLTRSLKYTLESIKKYIFNPLDRNNIKYDIFLHTYYFDGLYNNKWGKESNIKLDFDEYKLLNPKYFKIDNQDEIKKTIDFSKFNYPGNRPRHYTFETHRNGILGLYSMKQVTLLIEESKNKYDFIWFVRPDCKYLRPFSVRWFRLTKGIKYLTPHFGKSGGYNNRMILGNYNQGMILGKAIDYLEEYTNKYKYIAEPFIKWLVHTKCFPNSKTLVRFIKYSFQRIRANGEVAKLDRRLNGF